MRHKDEGGSTANVRFGSKTDRHVRFVPKADITHRSERSLLFDHLVGAGEHRPGNGKTERLGALQVDDKLEFGRLLHRQVGWLLTVQYPAGVLPSYSIHLEDTSAVRHQSSCCWEPPVEIKRGDAVLRCQLGQSDAQSFEEWIVTDK